MNIVKIVGSIACCSSLLGCAGADLVVTDFRATAPPTINSNNSVELPVQITVQNIGSTSAGVFKLSTEYTDSSGSTYVVACTVPGQSDIWYPHTSGPLAAGDEVTFANGVLTFAPFLHGVTVTVKAIADSCAGDEFMPSYCRVAECNETNNESTSILVDLP